MSLVLQRGHTRCPALSNAANLRLKLLARNLLSFLPHDLVGLEEGVLKQADIRILNGPEHDLELGLAKPDARGHGGSGSGRGRGSDRRNTGTGLPAQDGRVDSPPAHVHHDYDLDPRVRLEAVGGEALVDGVQEPHLAGEAGSGPRCMPGAELEDVEG